MLRLIQDEGTGRRGRDFLNMVEEGQRKGEPLKTRDWKRMMEDLGVSRSAFYFMRNKLLGAGLIAVRSGEYRLSGMFSRDLADMSRWWWTAVMRNDPEAL